MARRQFSREFKLEAIRLVKERGVSVVQASRDLDVSENVLRRWIKVLSCVENWALPHSPCCFVTQREGREHAEVESRRGHTWFASASLTD